MIRIFGRVCTDFEAQQIAMDGEDDHVHLLAEYPPKVAVSNLVNSLKGYPVACCARKDPLSRNATGRACCDLRTTSPHPAAVRQSPSCDSTSSSSKHPINPKGGYAVHAIPPNL